MSALPIPQPARRELPQQIVLGPYELRLQFHERAELYDKCKLACLNFEDGRMELREDLEGMRLAEAFLDALIRLMHFSKGSQQGCLEEAYSYSLATGSW